MVGDFHHCTDGGTPFLESVGQWKSAIKDFFLGKMLLSNDVEVVFFICGCQAPDVEHRSFLLCLTLDAKPEIRSAAMLNVTRELQYWFDEIITWHQGITGDIASQVFRFLFISGYHRSPRFGGMFAPLIFIFNLFNHKEEEQVIRMLDMIILSHSRKSLFEHSQLHFQRLRKRWYSTRLPCHFTIWESLEM